MKSSDVAEPIPVPEEVFQSKNSVRPADPGARERDLMLRGLPGVISLEVIDMAQGQRIVNLMRAAFGPKWCHLNGACFQSWVEDREGKIVGGISTAILPANNK